MSETITLQALDLSGETLTMFLRKSDGTLLNTGGDAMTESGSTGVFTATLAESRTGLGPLAVRICAGSETADNLLYDGFLVEGTTVIDSVMRAELDTVRQQALADLAAMITGSGTGDAKFDAMALSLAPSGSSSGDWTDGEKAQIRYRLAIDGTATAPTEPEAEPIVVTPATGIMTTGWLVTRVNGVPTAGIKIYYQHVQEPTADRGSSYDDTIYSSTSNSEGIAELSLVKGGLYYIWRSSATRPKDCIAYRVLKADGTAPDSTLELPSHIGHGSAA